MYGVSRLGGCHTAYVVCSASPYAWLHLPGLHAWDTVETQLIKPTETFAVKYSSSWSWYPSWWIQGISAGVGLAKKYLRRSVGKHKPVCRGRCHSQACLVDGWCIKGHEFEFFFLFWEWDIVHPKLLYTRHLDYMLFSIFYFIDKNRIKLGGFGALSICVCFTFTGDISAWRLWAAEV